MEIIQNLVLIFQIMKILKENPEGITTAAKLIEKYNDLARALSNSDKILSEIICSTQTTLQ